MKKKIRIGYVLVKELNGEKFRQELVHNQLRRTNPCRMKKINSLPHSRMASGHVFAIVITSDPCNNKKTGTACFCCPKLLQCIMSLLGVSHSYLAFQLNSKILNPASTHASLFNYFTNRSEIQDLKSQFKVPQ